jgi:hypothetical protein
VTEGADAFQPVAGLGGGPGLLHVAFIHGSNDLYGASRVLLTDVRILTDAGIRVTVVLPSSGPLDGLLREAGALVAIEPLAILRKVASLSQLRLPLRLPNAARDADIIVLWTLASASYLVAARLARKFTISSVHEILPGRAGSILRAFARSLSTRLMVNSGATRDWLVAGARLSQEPILAYPVAPAYAPTSLPASEGELSLLLAGRINGHKGHLEAVEACAAAIDAGLPGLQLTLLGGCYPGQEGHLGQLLDAIADKPWVSYAGEANSITCALDACDALLVPTMRAEPFGIVALEAWAAGRRVIASDEGGLAEAARLVDGVLVPPRDIDALSRAIVAFACSPTMRSAPSRDAEVARTCTSAARSIAWRSALPGR